MVKKTGRPEILANRPSLFQDSGEAKNSLEIDTFPAADRNRLAEITKALGADELTKTPFLVLATQAHKKTPRMFLSNLSLRRARIRKSASMQTS